MELRSGSPADTEAIAAHLASGLAPGDVVTIGHRYEGDPDVSHLDLYRFTAVSHAEWGDLEPYFEDAVVFVEWPEAAAGGLPAVRAAVRLEHVDLESRRIVIEGDVPFGDGADPGLRHGN